MKILIAHNYYQQAGGEDTAVQFEVELLRNHGHEVSFFKAYNEDFNKLNIPSKFRNIWSWDWSKNSYSLIHEECLRFKPDIAHFHNTFFMMTPSVYSACKNLGVPVVQTLHNFRLFCSNALFYRDGHVCEECLQHSLYRGIRYGCYRDSRVLTAAVVKMLKEYRRRRIWEKEIDAYIALSEFSRQKFIEGGLPSEKIYVKGNSVLQNPARERESGGDYFVFAGRLSQEKGVGVLLEAFKNVPQATLVLLGEGALKPWVANYVNKHNLKNVSLQGFLPKEEYLAVLNKAKALILPSRCYENFPLTIVEAFSLGIPVIASRHGPIPELVEDGSTGFLFAAGDSKELALKIMQACEDPEKLSAMSENARSKFIHDFSPEKNYEQLMSIYSQVRS